MQSLEAMWLLMPKRDLMDITYPMLIMKPAADFVCLMVQAIQRLHDQYNVIEEVVSSLEVSLSLRCLLRNTCRIAGHQMFVPV